MLAAGLGAAEGQTAGASVLRRSGMPLSGLTSGSSNGSRLLGIPQTWTAAIETGECAAGRLSVGAEESQQEPASGHGGRPADHVASVSSPRLPSLVQRDESAGQPWHAFQAHQPACEISTNARPRRHNTTKPDSCPRGRAMGARTSSSLRSLCAAVSAHAAPRHDVLCS